MVGAAEDLVGDLRRRAGCGLRRGELGIGGERRGARRWAHLDIAGTGNDSGKAYASKGGTGVPVRLLVELARRVADRG